MGKILLGFGQGNQVDLQKYIITAALKTLVLGGTICLSDQSQIYLFFIPCGAEIKALAILKKVKYILCTPKH